MDAASTTSAIDDAIKESSFEIYVKPNMAVGVVLSQTTPPRIMQLLPCSAMLGKLFVNDVIIAVDDKPVKNTPMFIEAVRAATGRKIKIKYRRKEWYSSHVKMLPMPRPGWESFELDLYWREVDAPLGILIHEDSYGRIVISMVQNGSVASKMLRPGDILVKINNKPISNKYVAKQMINDCVKANNTIKFTMERQLEMNSSKITTKSPPVTTSTSSSAIQTCAANCYSVTSSNLSTNTTAVISSSSIAPQIPPSNVKVDRKEANAMEMTNKKSEKAPPNSMATVFLKQMHKPGPKLPNCDYCLPKDVLAVLTANRNFYKNDSICQPILLNPIQKGTGLLHINLKEPKGTDEEKIAFDYGEGLLKQTPKNS
uniref:PDZ domain-containing protein n=3 Tax=Wuchereria bancrofti TaxID=6293 RepID=A0AAF5PWN5_WUCBA